MPRFQRLAVVIALLLLAALAFFQGSAWRDTQRAKAEAKQAAEAAAATERAAQIEELVTAWMALAPDLHATVVSSGDPPTSEQRDSLRQLMNDTAHLFPGLFEVNAVTGRPYCLPVKSACDEGRRYDDLPSGLIYVLHRADPLAAQPCYLSDTDACHQGKLLFDALMVLYAPYLPDSK